jgi:hypothetical protein
LSTSALGFSTRSDMDAENPSPARLRSAGDLAGDGGGGVGWGGVGSGGRREARERGGTEAERREQ